MSSRYTYCSNTPGKTSRNQRVLKIPIWKSHYQLILAHVNVTKDILLVEDRPLFFISYLFCSWSTIWQKLHGVFSKIITQVARITESDNLPFSFSNMLDPFKFYRSPALQRELGIFLYTWMGLGKNWSWFFIFRGSDENQNHRWLGFITMLK